MDEIKIHRVKTDPVRYTLTAKGMEKLRVPRPFIITMATQLTNNLIQSGLSYCNSIDQHDKTFSRNEAIKKLNNHPWTIRRDKDETSIRTQILQSLYNVVKVNYQKYFDNTDSMYDILSTMREITEHGNTLHKYMYALDKYGFPRWLPLMFCELVEEEYEYFPIDTLTIYRDNTKIKERK